jgi:hypothetical protein
VDLVSLVSNSDQRLNPNVLRNLLSRSKMMICGIPKWTDTHSRKSLEVSATVMFFLQAMRMAIFETNQRPQIHNHCLSWWMEG